MISSGGGCPAEASVERLVENGWMHCNGNTVHSFASPLHFGKLLMPLHPYSAHFYTSKQVLHYGPCPSPA